LSDANATWTDEEHAATLNNAVFRQRHDGGDRQAGSSEEPRERLIRAIRV